MQRILSYMRKAIEEYKMIEEGDKIAVCLSGGKDSITMLSAFKALQRFYPKKFEIIAISINPGFEFFDTKLLENICNNLDIPLFIGESNAKAIVFDIRKEKNPCSLCAKMRRGALCTTCNEIGYNKLALAHNADDMIETFMLSLSHENRLNAMQPKSYMSKTDVTVIRPLIFLWENQIKEYTKDFKILKNSCPIDRKTERENMKETIKKINKIFPYFNKKLFEAIINYERYNLIKN